MRRTDGRDPQALRPVTIERNYLKFAEGSVLISMGDTRVLCTATVEEKVPKFLQNTGRGWLTAEYAMLPRSSGRRIPREGHAGRLGGRTHEIQRLIGRSLRAVVDLDKIGPRTVIIDCDVIQADGGTRTAAVTGAFVALTDTLNALIDAGAIASTPLIDTLAAVSVGVVDGVPIVDLSYEEDSTAEVDMNVIMTGSNKFIEVQGTAEGAPFSRKDLDDLLELASGGIQELIHIQRVALESAVQPLL